MFVKFASLRSGQTPFATTSSVHSSSTRRTQPTTQTMLGSLLHFETKKQREDKQRAQRKDQERKKRRREATTSTKKDDGRNQNQPSANATMQLNRTWQGGATSASSSSSSFRDRSRSFDTFDAAGRKRSISNQDLNAAVHALASSRTFSGSISGGGSVSTSAASARSGSSQQHHQRSISTSSGLRRPRPSHPSTRTNSARPSLFPLREDDHLPKNGRSVSSRPPPHPATGVGGGASFSPLMPSEDMATTIHGAFESSVQATPQRTAIICSDVRNFSLLWTILFLVLIDL